MVQTETKTKKRKTRAFKVRARPAPTIHKLAGLINSTLPVSACMEAGGIYYESWSAVTCKKCLHSKNN